MRLLILLPVVLGLLACGEHPSPSAERPMPSNVVGARCQRDTDCASRCMTGAIFPGGFCSLHCVTQGQCPQGTVCVSVKDGVCVYPCNTTIDCSLAGSNYSCTGKTDFAGGLYDVCVGG